MVSGTALTYLVKPARCLEVPSIEFVLLSVSQCVKLMLYIFVYLQMVVAKAKSCFANLEELFVIDVSVFDYLRGTAYRS